MGAELTDPVLETGAARPSPPRGPGPQVGDPLTTGEYLRAFAPENERWDALADWPPDVFAATNLLLDHSEAYRFSVAPPSGERWPPEPDWSASVRQTAGEWCDSLDRGGSMPAAVAALWEVIARGREVSLADLRRGEEWELCRALLTLQAIADETCARVSMGAPAPTGAFERRAGEMLADRGSLSRFSPARLRVLPKTHFPERGITIRSMSRYLSLTYEAVDLRWRRVHSVARADRTYTGGTEYNLLLLPWPLEIHPDDFRPVEGPLENMDSTAFGFFEFAPREPFDMDRFERVLDAARADGEAVDAVVLPESSVLPDEVIQIESRLSAHGIGVLIAGVREPAAAGRFGRNYVQVGVCTEQGWETFRQSKHHRWCLDGSQIRQYDLDRVFDPTKRWWEAIDLPARTLEIIDVGGGATTAPLVCEDLGCVDEVSDVLRRIGPTMIVALLLDGPQLAGRWACRYASVFADDPGSAVLTLTSFGMVARSRPPGCSASRVVAMWKDPTGGLHEIALDPGAGGVVLSASVRPKSVWSADGRFHQDCTPDLAFSRIRQLHPS
jgi:hypothetical protein